jgi:ribosomal protein S6
MAGQWSAWARRRAILLYHVVHFSALVPLLAEAGERALITVFVRILQAVNVNAAASAAEKVSYETMVVLRVRGPGVVLRCVVLRCVVLRCVVSHCGVLHCVMLRRFRVCVSILVLTRVVRSPNSNLQSPISQPDLTDEQRDSEVRLWPKDAPAKYAPTRTHSCGQPTRPLARQLAKFEAFLQKSGAEEIQVTIRGRQRLAYPIKTFADGIYVLYTYDADPQVVAPVQKLLSTPTAGAELNVLRHMTFRI